MASIYHHADHDHIGRVLAMRHRVGPGYLFDVRERWKAKRQSAPAGSSTCPRYRGTMGGEERA
jgi:hypothetical protein